MTDISPFCIVALMALAAPAVPVIVVALLRWLRRERGTVAWPGAKCRIVDVEILTNEKQIGDRVRIVGGVWEGEWGTVVLVAKNAIKVRLGTRLLNVIVRPYDLERK